MCRVTPGMEDETSRLTRQARLLGRAALADVFCLRRRGALAAAAMLSMMRAVEGEEKKAEAPEPTGSTGPAY